MTDTVSIASGSTASPSPNPAPAPLPIDLSAAIVATNEAASAAVAAAEAAAADREQTGEDRVAAGNSAGEALTQAGLAATAKAAAETARDTAQKWATQTDAEVVTGQGYGAKKYALDAAGHAGEAAGQVGLAAAQVTLATTAKTDAVAAKGAAESARDLTLGYRDTTQSLKDSASALALQAQGYMNSAAVSAASASAVSGLSNLSAAARAIVAATDVRSVIIYDTTRDSDGGAWRQKVAHTSWMQEPLNTATRGSTAKYPKMMLIVGRNSLSAAITIYDMSDPTVPMWAVFSGASLSFMGSYAGSGITAGTISIAALNGKMFVSYGNNEGTRTVDLISDTASVEYGNLRLVWNGRIADRNLTTLSVTQLPNGVQAIAHNSIATTVLPNTPLNQLRCNLPNPTSAVGTGGGASVIRWDGVAVKSASTTAVLSLCFDIPALPGAAPNLWTLTAAGLNVTNQYQSASWAVAGLASFTAAQLGVGTLAKVSPCGPGMVAVAGTTGSARIMLDAANPANSLIFNRTTAYATGYMPGAQGAIKLALSESSADLTGLADASTVSDRSAAGNHAVVNGTLTRSVVATGADLAAFGGFSAANYLEVPYSSGLDFGTGDFCAAMWATLNGTSYQGLICYGVAGGSTTGGWGIVASGSGQISFGVFTASLASSSLAPALGTPVFIVCQRRSGVAEIYINGVKCGSSSLTGSASLAGATLRLGSFGNSMGVWSPATIANNPTNIALPRVTAMAMTPDQIAAIYAAELPMVAANAKCLLSGASVQALAYDPDTDQLAVANSTAGTDLFKGLVRVGNVNSATATNKVRNSQARGAVVGNPGTLPTGWTTGAVSGLAINVIGTGVINGNGYVDIQVVGTPSVSGGVSIYPEAGNIAVAASGQTWTAAMQLALVGGALTNITSIKLAAEGNASNGGWLEWSATTISSASITAALANFTNTCTMANASTVFAQPLLQFGVISGQAVNFTIRISQPYLAQVAAFTAFTDGLTASPNAKSVAFTGSDLIIGTAGGVDAIIAAKPGLSETARKRLPAPVYDPTWGIYQGVTTDATPTVIAAVPIPEGRAARFRARIAAVQYGGVATEKAVYVIDGLVTRDIGGNAVVVATTTTVSEVTSAMDCAASANTTAQTLEIKATGKAATRLAWVAAIDWDDSGLMGAA